MKHYIINTLNNGTTIYLSGHLSIQGEIALITTNKVTAKPQYNFEELDPDTILFAGPLKNHSIIQELTSKEKKEEKINNINDNLPF